MRFLLDEGINPKVSTHADELGIDVASVHEIRRLGLTDWEQLLLAADDGRILVTRNRADSLHCSAELFRAGQRHRGVLIVPWSLANERPAAIAHALKRWATAHADAGADGFGQYHVDFLAP